MYIYIYVHTNILKHSATHSKKMVVKVVIHLNFRDEANMITRILSRLMKVVGRNKIDLQIGIGYI